MTSTPTPRPTRARRRDRAGDHRGRHRRARSAGGRGGAEEFYGFDTEFHTERTYVPDLALIQIAWADKVALVDPLAVDPAPLAAVFGGPGIAVAHAASQDLDVLMAACGAIPATVFDTQIVAGFLGHVHALAGPPRRPDARRVAAQGGPALGLARPADLGHQISYALNDVAHLLELRDGAHRAAAGAGAPGVGPQRMRPGAGRPHPGRVPEEAWWKLGDIRGMSRRSAPSRRRWRRGASARRPRPTGPGAWSSRTSGCWRSRSGRPATTTSCAAPGASTGGTWPRAGRPRSSAPSSAASPSRRSRSGCPRRDATPPAPPAAVAVCSGVVRQIADDLDFDQGLLATRADIAQLLCGEPSRLDTGWRRTIVGDPLRRLIAGEVAAAFDERGHLRHGGALRSRPARRRGPSAAPVS